jgi:hypothetical protein
MNLRDMLKSVKDKNTKIRMIYEAVETGEYQALLIQDLQQGKKPIALPKSLLLEETTTKLIEHIQQSDFNFSNVKLPKIKPQTVEELMPLFCSYNPEDKRAYTLCVFYDFESQKITATDSVWLASVDYKVDAEKYIAVRDSNICQMGDDIVKYMQDSSGYPLYKMILDSEKEDIKTYGVNDNELKKLRQRLLVATLLNGMFNKADVITLTTNNGQYDTRRAFEIINRLIASGAKEITFKKNRSEAKNNPLYIDSDNGFKIALTNKNREADKVNLISFDVKIGEVCWSTTPELKTQGFPCHKNNERIV